MKNRLQQAGLWRSEEGSEITIATAWSILSRLGHPGRYLGRAQDGCHEYGIIDLHTGDLLTTGKGVTVESAMCEAALNASGFISTSATGRRGVPVHSIPGSGSPVAGQNVRQQASNR